MPSVMEEIKLDKDDLGEAKALMENFTLSCLSNTSEEWIRSALSSVWQKHGVRNELNVHSERHALWQTENNWEK